MSTRSRRDRPKELAEALERARTQRLAGIAGRMGTERPSATRNITVSARDHRRVRRKATARVSGMARKGSKAIATSVGTSGMVVDPKRPMVRHGKRRVDCGWRSGQCMC